MYSNVYMFNSSLSLWAICSPGNHKLVFNIHDSTSVLLINSFVPFLKYSTYKRYHMIFVFLFLTYLTHYDTLLEKKMATHSSILAWRILWTEESGGLLSIVSHRAKHDWSDLACMHALEKEMATHSSFLAWRIPGTEEPDGLLSMGSQRVGHDWSDLAATDTLWSMTIHIAVKWHYFVHFYWWVIFHCI